VHAISQANNGLAEITFFGEKKLIKAFNSFSYKIEV